MKKGSVFIFRVQLPRLALKITGIQSMQTSVTTYRLTGHNNEQVSNIQQHEVRTLNLSNSSFLKNSLFSITENSCCNNDAVRLTTLSLDCLDFNPLALELDIYSLAHHLRKMWIFYEPRRVTLGNTLHFVEE